MAAISKTNQWKNTTYQAIHMFQDNNSDWHSGNGPYPMHATVNMKKSKYVITKIKMRARPSNDAMLPKKFDFQGSNDGINWETIFNSEKNENYNLMNKSTKEYNIEKNLKPFNYFRFYIYSTNDTYRNPGCVSISFLQLYGFTEDEYSNIIKTL